MPFRTSLPAPLKLREQTRIGKATNNAGVELVLNATSIPYEYQQVPNNSDNFYYYLICSGSETTLRLIYRKSNDCGIVDLYINGVLDSSGYDMYSAGPAYNDTLITLTIKPIAGINTILLKTNGKNGASTNYYFYSMYAVIQ